MKRHTYEAGIVGNCAYSALIQKDTRVVWMCLPKFDSSFIFGRLLDEKKGGQFAVLPTEGAKKLHFSQQYLNNTNILETTVTSKEGSYKVTDFAPRFYLYGRYFKPLMLFRKIEKLSGQPHIRVICQPVAEYGAYLLTASMGSNHIRYHGLGESLRLTSTVPLTYLLEGRSFVLESVKYLALSYGPPLEAPLEETCENFLRRTTDYWRDWVMGISVPRLHQLPFIRSALTLKLHQYEDTGAVIASATMALPEAPHAGRNWDYRYCWMRDTYYTMHVLGSIGHYEELEKYFQYLLNIAREHRRYRPLYRVNGQPILEEKVLDLEGYQGNKPVRLGNQASEHIQNDAYGQVLLALLPLYSDKRLQQHYQEMPYGLVEEALDMIAKTMDEQDAGLWEFRNQAGWHCYTYLFHWAGAYAAEKISKIIGNKRIAQKARRLYQAASKKIEACYVHAKKGYAQKINSTEMDASTLQLITMGYLRGNTTRAKQHLRALEKELQAKGSLFYRYRHADDFGTPKSTFLICAFWHVEALACVGEVERALEQFEQLLTYGNHLGLMSEDIDEQDGSQWGNFPQVYSHVGLISALARIDKHMDVPLFQIP